MKRLLSGVVHPYFLGEEASQQLGLLVAAGGYSSIQPGEWRYRSLAADSLFVLHKGSLFPNLWATQHVLLVLLSLKAHLLVTTIFLQVLVTPTRVPFV